VSGSLPSPWGSASNISSAAASRIQYRVA
jgi:hypothetical protein